jgi:predicted transcriptional regulator
MTVTISVELDERERERLQEMARRLEREPDWLVREAIQRYLDVEAADLEAVDEGLRQAEAGEFAHDDHVAKVLRRR